MTTPVLPAMPSFADLQAQQASIQPVPPNAPSGGATQPSVPASQPGGGSPPPAVSQPTVPQPYVAELERLGRIPVGRFTNDRDLIDTLYGTAENLATQVEQFEARQAAPVQPAAPVVPATPVADVTKMATVFQQNGWLALQNGQWVATNPMATQLATQMNASIMEAQARQAELAENPSAFISKHGADVFKQALSPLQQEIETLRQQNQQLQQQFEASTPRLDKTWVETNKAQLYTTDAAGKEVPTQAGKAYGEAWEMARAAGKPIDQIHSFALSVATPYLAAAATPAPAPAPPQTWVQQVLSNPGTDPSFTAPGTVLNKSVPPNGIGYPVDNDGYPSFSKLQGLGIQAR